MKIDLKTSGAVEVQRMLAGIGKEAPKAVRLWANWVGLEAQGQMRSQIPQRFQMRGTTELFRKAIVFNEMRGQRTHAELTVGAPTTPGGTKASATKNLGRILARHEEAETRTENSQVFFNGRGQAMTGLGFFLPAKGLRTSTTNPPRKLYPSSIGASLRLTPESNLILATGTKKGSKAKGTGTSYFATREGIFRRRHSSFGGKVQAEAVWWFRKQIRTPARLRLWETAEKVFQTRATALGLQAIEETLFRMTL